ncbi:MAG TPA: GIY-YIG nuclease family protein [Candidatus Acidoferrales bacterium]|nr:GIY-YIG nuclease family protein [Candidatus Acidoferrales bacterium]
MANTTISVVSEYIKLWPREVFYIDDAKCDKELNSVLDKPGIYILYNDFDVFYVGQSEHLYERLHDHAWKRYRLWNHFSAFVVPDKDNLDDVEAIMIAASPRSTNRQSGKRIERISLPKGVEEKILNRRSI